MLQKQSQMKAAEKLTAKLSAKTLIDLKNKENKSVFGRSNGIISIENPHHTGEHLDHNNQSLDDQLQNIVSRANASNSNSDLKVIIGGPGKSQGIS